MALAGSRWKVVEEEIVHRDKQEISVH